MNTDLQTLREEISRDHWEEISRDHWIAAQAAGRISKGEPLASIESEPLEALSEWIRAELQDRDLRDTCTMKPF